MKELWLNLVLLKFEHRCGLSKSTGSAGPGENNSEDEYPNHLDSDIHLHNTCETDLNDDGTFRDISEDSSNTDCVIENKICKGNDGCPIWNNKKRGYSIRSCDESDFSSYVCGESENSSKIEHFGIITSTNDSDSTDIESPTEQDSTQIESPTEQDSTPSYKHLWVLCEECYTLNYKRFLKERLYICEACESHLKMNSSERIELLIDPNTWDPMNEKMASMDPIEWDSEEALSESDSEWDWEDPIEWDWEEDPVEWDWEEDPIESDSEWDFEVESELQSVLESEVESSFYSSFYSMASEFDPESESKLDSELDSGETPIQLDSEVESNSESNSELDSELESKWDSKLDSEEAPIQLDPELVAALQLDSEQVAAIQSDSKKVAAFQSYFKFYLEVNKLESYSMDSEEAPIELDFEDDPYIDRIDSCQKETGLTEAIQTGIGQLNGIPVAMGVMEFEFMAGTMGSVVGEKITRLIEYATNQSLPLIIVCASGGARMQEGSLSLLQMAKISSALYHFQTNQKLFYVSILTSPTTGGVTASFGMLGDIIVAEPNAYIAFAGKRVIEETLKKEVPEGSQETEPLFDKGLFNLVVPRNTLKSVLNELFQFHGFFPLNQNSIE
nr:acetyl-CoA carboxylase carboxyltransferase beta [Kolkwitzia amabilis]